MQNHIGHGKTGQIGQHQPEQDGQAAQIRTSATNPHGIVTCLLIRRGDGHEFLGIPTSAKPNNSRPQNHPHTQFG